MIATASKGNHLLKLYEKRMAELKVERDNEAVLRKQAEEKYCSFQHYIESLFDNMTDIIFTLDKEWKFISLNKRTEQGLGRPKQDLIGTSAVDLLPRCIGNNVYSQCVKAMQENMEVHFDLYEPDLNQWLEVNTYPHQDILAVFIRDITKHKVAEEAFRGSKQVIDDIINFLPDVTIVVDCQGRVIAWNRAAEDMTGIKCDDIWGQGDYAYAVPFYGERRPILVDLVLKPEEQWEKEYEKIYRKGNVLIGERSYALARVSGLYLRGTAAPLYDPAGNIIGAIECISDISDHRRTEEALRNSEEMYRCIVETANEGIWLLDQDNKIILVNKKMAQMLGYDIDEIMGESLYKFMDEEWEIIARKYSLLKQQGLVETCEFKYLRKNGDALWALSSITPVYDKENNFSGSLAMITDITERKKAEEALRNNEEMYRRIVETANEGIGMTDDVGTVLFANHKLAEMLGYDADEMINMSLYDFTFKDDKLLIDDLMERRRRGVKEVYNIKYRRKDGSALWAIVVVQPIVDNSGNYVGSLGMVTDISENRKLEMEVAYLDRLNLVGEIAAGIGHEIRNPMTAVRGFLQILGQDEKYLHDKEHFNLMIEELDRANSIITEFLSLAKNREVKLEAGDLNDVIAAILPLIQAEAIVHDKHISINLKPIPDLLLDEREIRQLILNLVRNGLDAMQSGGILSIETFTSNNEVVLAIKDQGSGLDESILDKLGTPFITTKENGTGLGLPVCYSIAARHRARITLETSPDGTNFYVIFHVPHIDC